MTTDDDGGDVQIGGDRGFCDGRLGRDIALLDLKDVSLQRQRGMTRKRV